MPGGRIATPTHPVVGEKPLAVPCAGKCDRPNGTGGIMFGISDPGHGIATSHRKAATLAKPLLLIAGANEKIAALAAHFECAVQACQFKLGFTPQCQIGHPADHADRLSVKVADHVPAV